MPVVPSKSVDKIEFYENHITPWTDHVVAIGTTTGAVDALEALTTAARDSFNEQQAAQSAAKAATLKMQIAVDAMASAGAAIIAQIRSMATRSDDGVYSLASIPVPAKPSPIGEPGTPAGFSVELNQDGSLSLKWKCTNPAGAAGTMYQVHRRIGSTGDFQYIGGTGGKKFVDDTLPAGTPAVIYQVQAIRSTAIGPVAQYNVNLGANGNAIRPSSIPNKTRIATTKPARIAA